MTTIVLPRPAPALGADAEARVAAIADDPELASGFTTWEHAPDGRRVGRSHLRLAGLWCAGCAGTVERALGAEPGVLEASASYAAQRASVVWDPAQTRLSLLLGAVQRAGYEAVPDAAAPARALRKAEERTALWRLFVAVFAMMQVMMYQAPLYVAAPGTLSADLRTLLLWAAWVISIPVVVFSAAPMFRDAWQGVRQGRIGMDLPVSIGIALTFVVSSGATFSPGGVFGAEPYFDSLTMFVAFLLGGRFLALKMRNRVAASLEGALARLPAVVRRLGDDGTTSLIAIHRLQRGDRVRVLAGEAFPADGVLLEGETDADEALLTGESRPVAKRRGDEAIAGSINLRGAVVQRADRVGADTRYEGIVALMRTAMTDRPPLLRAADRVAGPFLWGVLALAALAAVAWSFIDPSRAVWVAVAVLIVTCPCALSLAAPSALLAAAGALVRRGVLVQRFEALEALASLDTICFDKTGTLTEPGPEAIVVALQPAALRAGMDEAAVRAIAGVLGASSTHPLSAALAAQAPGGPAPVALADVAEQPGRGVEARASDGSRYRLGSLAWIGEGEVGTPLAASAAGGPEAWLGGPDGPLACFRFAEVLRHDARRSVDLLSDSGLAIELLSGDATTRVEAVARELGVTRCRGDASPADKLAAVAALQADGHRVAMVGDGLNDAPVMARADVSFAIGDGPALTRSHADFVLLSGSLADVAAARTIARRAMRVVRQNLGWAIAYNAVCVPVALLGWFPPWAAGLGMATSSLVVVLNALRIDRGGARTVAGASTP
ncbi:MAG TPA: cation-translocating P-type ATPase [Caldimonas sp.]|nr:cation-translocating P-type ATPase [Caldimonas sp.]